MFVAHVECTVCGHHHAARGVLTVCVRCGQMLAVRYDLPRVAAALTKDALARRPPGMYRFRELLPLAAGEEPITLMRYSYDEQRRLVEVLPRRDRPKQTPTGRAPKPKRSAARCGPS